MPSNENLTEPSDGSSQGSPTDEPRARRWRGRSWPTWVFVVTLLAAGTVGMVLGYLPRRSHNSAVASPSGPAFPTGPAGGPPSTGGSSAKPPDVVNGTHNYASTSLAPAKNITGLATAPTATTTAASTTVEPASTTSTLPVMRVVVLQTPQTNGPSLTPEFTISHAPYEVGYAYDCQAAPTARQSFQVSVLTSYGPVSSPLIFSKDARGAGTKAVTITGQQRLVVDTVAACTWVLKVVAP